MLLFFCTPIEKTGKMEVAEKGKRKEYLLIWLGTSMKKCKGGKRRKNGGEDQTKERRSKPLKIPQFEEIKAMCMIAHHGHYSKCD